MTAPVLVLGVGNILLRDEGVGVHVVQAMQGIDCPDGVELCDGGTAGLDLLDVLADRRKVIIIDAMAGEHEPGMVLRLTPGDLAPPSGPGASLHELGLLQTLAVAGQLGCAPQEVVIFGIAPQEISYGLELSPEIAALIPEVIELVLAEAVA
jgi:hydrogenase maturation protease